MLQFVKSYVEQNRSRKQTLESAQCGLEISFETVASIEKRLTLIIICYKTQDFTK